jgi:hypothetical protein
MVQTQHTRSSKNTKRTRRSRQRPGNQRTTTTMRRRLRREVPSTVGLLADEQDFAAMRRYRTFGFDDHDSYLRQIEGLLKSLTAQGIHTTVALFDPDEFAEHCADTGRDPDAAASRSHFTSRIAATGAAVSYAGQSLDSLIPLLVNTAVRQATWEYATLLLADFGECADCGQDIGRAAFDRASALLLRLLDAAGPGIHQLVSSVSAGDEQLLAVLHCDCADGAPAQLDSSEGTEFVTVLAVGIALEATGGVVLRTTSPDTADRLRGWRLRQGQLVPLTAGEVFSAYCTDAESGEPLSPEPDVEYCPGFALALDEPHTHH